MTGRSWDEWIELAAERLPEPVLDYFLQGARDRVTTSEASAAWDAWRLVPRVLRDVTEIESGTSLLGTDVRMPLGIAPTSLQKAAHPDGEVAMARAVARSDSLLVLSSNSGSTFEQVAATGVRWWLQMYVTSDRAATLPVLERAASSGASAIVLTTDTPVVGTMYGPGANVWDVVDPRWLRVNFPELNDTEKALDLGPQDIDWLATASGLPVVVKGVLHPVDARRCVDAGAAAVWVSNHGGRQQDFAVATAAVLADIAAAVDGRAQVYVDGGVRTGRHVAVAEALGADAVFLGRPPLLALAAAGEEGVVGLLGQLFQEYIEARRLLGTPLRADLARTLLYR
jgi:4-hydroxymandelate oxidase